MYECILPEDTWTKEAAVGNMSEFPVKRGSARGYEFEVFIIDELVEQHLYLATFARRDWATMDLPEVSEGRLLTTM